MLIKNRKSIICLKNRLILLACCLITLVTYGQPRSTNDNLSYRQVSDEHALQRSFTQTPSLLGDLKFGKYSVGFKQMLTFDLTRPPILSTTVDEKVIGRQMQINVWYPARNVGSNSKRMRFEDYVNLLANEIDFTPIDKDKRQQSVEKFIEKTSELGGDSNNLKSQLPLLLGLSSFAIKDGEILEGRFPLIIYQGSPAQTHILCEYLASHGYVVASPTMKGTFEQDLDVALTGIETISADIAFTVGEMKKWSNVDGKKLAFMGLGISASGALIAQMRNPEVDAFISLDGGVPTLFEDRMLKRLPFFDIASFQVPLLGIHAPHPNVDVTIFDQYKYSTRHYVHFPKMSEYHFLNYGMLEKFAPNIIGKAPGDTKSGFEWASRYVLNFLNAYLKNDSVSMRFLENAPEANTIPTGILTIQKKVGFEPPLTFGTLKKMIQAEGIKSVTAIYQRLKQSDPQPFSQELLSKLFSWAAWKRDPDFKIRKEIALIRVDSFPQSSRANLVLADVARDLKEIELARKHYEESLRLLPNDFDPLLNLTLRNIVEQAAKRGLDGKK